MIIPQGGIWDKLGNRYEAKWLIRSFMDVIADRAQWLKFEGVITEFQGFEFAVSRGEIIEWHQTKMNSPNGNWTINALKKEGVLKAFLNRFSADEKAHCFFISQDNAKELRSVIEKAEIANSYDELSAILSKDQIESLKRLEEEWKQSDEIIFDWLKRSHCEIFPGRELDSFIESHGDLYFHNGGKKAFPVLRDILEKSFNKCLTVEKARNAIKQQGELKFKEWAFDPCIEQKLKEETEAYLQTYIPFGAGGDAIIREESDTIANEILKPDGARLILLTGVAGSGKSGVIRNTISKVRKADIPYLAFRVDHYLSCSTKEELGKELTGREESPVTTLKGSFPDKTSVLFIDQVDAVSEVSGRDGQVKEVIFRLISDASNFGGVRIVIICRKFDFDSDSRLKILKDRDLTKQIDLPLFEWKEDVEPFLKNKGMDISLLNEQQRKLLCLPINLAIFLEIDEPNLSFHSLSNLHEKLIEKKQRTISKERKPSWALLKPLSALCNWMSKRQKLSAPASVLDDYSNAIDILRSEGLIVSSRSYINFFHESLFDYVYARSFEKNDQSLLELLFSTEQHLFRRTQVRQILEALRQHDMERYLKELSSVLYNDKVRFHIKSAICYWLSFVENPSKKEFDILQCIDNNTGSFSQLFCNAVFPSHIWFDLLCESAWVENQLNNELKERSERVLWWLKVIAGKRPKEVSALLRSWWDGSDERAKRILQQFCFLRSGESYDDIFYLLDEIINTHPNFLFDDRDSPVKSLLHTLEEIQLKSAGKIIHSLFEAWFVLKPDCIPFDYDGLQFFDIHSLKEFAPKAPKAFLQGTTDALAHSIDMVLDQGETGTGKNWHNFNYRTYSGNRFDFDEFLGIYRSALNQTIKESPDIAIFYLNKLDPNKHESLMHLHLEAIQANPTAYAKCLPSLIANDIIFEAGWYGAKWLSFANACRSAFPYLNAEKKLLIEKVILAHVPEIDLAVSIIKEIKQCGESEPFWTKKSAIYQLNRSKYKQWCILETIGEEFLSRAALSRLYQLRRKFPKAHIDKPKHMEAHFVGSPIKRDYCKRMNDKQWLSAIERYSNNNDRKYNPDSIAGGASSLAIVLQSETKEEPERFSNLSLRIPDSAHNSYIEHILWGLTEAENPSDESLSQAVRHAHQHSEKIFGSAIVRLIGKHPQIAADPAILEMLIWYALHGDANESEEIDNYNTERETISITDLIQKGGALHIRGLNGARGAAWEAIASVLWELPDTTDYICDALEVALEQEHLLSVHCCMMNVLTPLFNIDKELFGQYIKQLIVMPDNASYKYDSQRLSPLITYEAIDLFPYMFYHLPDLADELVTELLESKDKTKELIGAWLIFRESFRNDKYIEKADNVASLSVAHRRLLTDITSQVIKWGDENTKRAEVLLKKFFFDEDKQIRNDAAEAFRNIDPKEAEKYQDLIKVFLKSPAFKDNSYAVLRLLEDTSCDVLDIVLEASQQIINNVIEDNDQRGNYAMAIRNLDNLLKREYVSSESNVGARKKILDQIDLMLKYEIGGVDSIVSAHDRW